MPKFKVLSGKHVENQRVYKEGEVLESPHDLADLFKNKFTPVPDDTPVTTGEPTAMLESKLKHEAMAEENKKELKEEPKEELKELEEPEEESTTHDFGNDVTDTYPLAHKKKVSVFKKGLHFTVVDKDGEQVNENPLNKKEIEDFLEKLPKGK